MIGTFAHDTVIVTSHNNSNIASVKLLEQKQSSLPVNINDKVIPQSEAVKYLGLHLDVKIKLNSAYQQEIEKKVKFFYWLLGAKSKSSLENQILIYKMVIKLIWT